MIERFAGRYALLRPLGQGGMGEVFLARDLTTGRECALKRVTHAVAASPELLRREFAILARLRHPAVVAVRELDFAPDGTPFYTMEYVPGVPADRALAGAGTTALGWVASQVAHGLEALHAAGIVHGDLKPSNVLVVPSPVPNRLPLAVRLLDFGLAGLLGQDTRGHRGTAGFAAPEVVRGEAATPASDLYGFGALLYAVLAGRPPYTGDGLEALLREQQAGPPPAQPLADAGVGAAWIELVLRLLASDPRERPRDAGALRRELEAIEPAARRPLAERLEGVVVTGRERELARLEAWLARSTKTRVVVLSGPSGIGKSALLAQMAARATLAGRAVAHLSCSSFAGPAAVALALARRFAVAAGADPDSLPDPAASPTHARTEDLIAPLVEAVLTHARWVDAPERVPIVLLDDSERLDPISRAFILRVALHPKAPPTYWAWARRVDEGSEIDETERALLAAGVAEPLELAPLSQADVARAAAARLQDTPPAALLGWLWARGAGNPGLTVALLRGAASSGALRDSDAGLWVDEPALEALAMPARFEESLLARADALPESALALANTLAVLGHAVAPAQALATARAVHAELDFGGALDELESTGLVKRDTEDRLGLVPPALDQRLIERIEPVLRQSLHRAALTAPGLTEADRFRHLAGAGDRAAAIEVARSLLDAWPDPRLAASAAALAEPEHPELAASLWERQATAFIANGRYAAAIPSLERALELDPESERRHERRATLAAAFLRAGDLARHASLTARALADQPPAASRARLLANQAAGLEIEGALERARATAEEALSAAESAGAGNAAVGLAASTLAAMAARQRDFETALGLARRAEAAHRQAGNLSGALRASVIPAWIAHERQEISEADVLYRRAIGEARTHGLRLALGELLLQHAVMLTEAGRWEEARDQCSEGARIALEDGRPGEAAASFANLAQLEGLTGGGHAALRQARSALHLAHAHAPRFRPLALRTLAQAHRIVGRPARAERLARRAVRLAIELALPVEIDWGRVELARCWIALGRWQAVDELVGQIENDREGSRSIGRVALITLGGRAALRHAAPTRGEQRLEAAESMLGGRVAPFARALTDLLRADLALVRGRTSEFVRHADRAFVALGTLPAPVERSAATADLAQLILQRRANTSAPVGEWLDQAIAVFDRLGDARSRERCLSLQVEWLRREGGNARAQVPERDLIEAVSRLLNSMSDLTELTNRSMELVVEQLKAERGVLLLADPETGTLEPIAELGAVDATMRNRAVGYSRRVVQRVTESGSSLLIGDAPSDPNARSESVVDLNLLSIVCVPMFVTGRVVGAVYLDDSRRSAAFGDSDRAMLEGFAQLMAIAIENSRGHLEVVRANEELVGENLALRRAVGSRFQPQGLIGRSLAMQKVLAVVEQAAKASSTVLLTGENGTGKELIARILHHAGKRRLKPFVTVNCGALTETLLESELFGILDDVATQVRKRDGRFVQANGGTLFLDEIGEMPLKQQVALLGVLANREVTPVGGGRSIPVDVRVIAATNRDLPQLIEQGQFREDLYFRLNVIPIEVPPLRDRKADIPALADHFLGVFAQQQERPVPVVSPNFMAVLTQSDWPGNVRELQNYIERLVAMQNHPTLEPIPLPRDLEDRGASVRFVEGLGLGSAVESLERKLLLEALEHAGGNQSLAARELGMTEQSLRYRLRKYGLSSSRSRRNLRLRKNPAFRGKR